MPPHDSAGYFVRLERAAGPAAPTGTSADRRSHDGHSPARPPVARRRHRRRLRPLEVVGLVLVAGLGWAATTPGGVSARFTDVGDALQGVVDDATTDPGLKRASGYYNDRFTRDGAYPYLTSEQVRDDPEAGWGMGVDVEWCSTNAIVLHSLTGRGTISRLLLSGEDLGDVPGKVACPTDISNPLPWRQADVCVLASAR